MGGLLDGLAVFHGDVEVHAGLLGTDLDLHALGDVAALAQQTAVGHVHHAGDALDFRRGDACDNGHHLIGINDVAAGLHVVQINVHRKSFLLGHKSAPPESKSGGICRKMGRLHHETGPSRTASPHYSIDCAAWQVFTQGLRGFSFITKRRQTFRPPPLVHDILSGEESRKAGAKGSLPEGAGIAARR